MKKLPGIILCLLIALPSWFLGRLVPLAGAPVIAILAGIIISLVFPKLIGMKTDNGFSFADGVRFTSKKLLQYSIVLLGFEMNLFNVMRTGRDSLFIMLWTFLAAFLAAFIVWKILKLPDKTTVLIAVGTSICGGSAIAATAPVIRANDEDVTRSISTIFLFNIIAVFIFPAIGRLIGMNDTEFGMWAGTAINDTSSVVAAGTAWSIAAGNNTALDFATIVKLTRTLMIIPITLFLAFYTAHKEKRGGNFHFTKVFPYFVLFFAAAALINTFIPLPQGVPQKLTLIGKFVIVMAMASIGLNTNLKSLVSSGIKPLILGLCCWFAVAAVSLAVENLR